MANPQEIWVYLAASPLLNLTLTLAAYLVGDTLFRKSGQKPIFNPVLIAIVILVTILTLRGTSYETYFAGAQFVHFLLGPATVALAIPLYRQFNRVKESAVAILVSLVVGSLTAVITAVLITWLLGAPQNVVASIAPKSATTPIAMGIAEQIGGLPSLTAVLVILTGITGAVVGTTVLEKLGVRSARQKALRWGWRRMASAPRALQVSELAGAFSALAMGLNGLATSLCGAGGDECD
ncbi:MAG: LrgB family protein [Anaerolineales bacterium]|nr:LrgB family protein [Anaerolineales bacterium]